MIQKSLEKAGHQLIITSGEDDFFTQFDDGNGWDLIILDHAPPVIDALHILKKANEIKSSTRAIFATTECTIELAMQSVKAGALDFIRKPLTSDAIVQSVNLTLGKSPEKKSTVSADQIYNIIGRTTINGYSASLISVEKDDRTKAWEVLYDVGSPDGVESEITVEIPAYTVELVKAYTDCEKMPGQESFWVAMAEEALMAYLLQEGELPADRKLIITSVGSGLRRWLDAVFTVH